jgi:hypothetical protein
MNLSTDHEAEILAGARTVPEQERDRYFGLVACDLRKRDRVRNQDVKRAVFSARSQCGAMNVAPEMTGRA